MKNNFFILHDEELIYSVNDMTKASSNLKTEIFKTITMNRDIDKSIIKKFLALANTYLKYWDDYSRDLHDEIKNAKGHEGLKNIEYNYVKDFIYGKYDYASILQFADAVARGIESKDMNKPSDIRDFFSYSIENAFNDQPDNVAGLIDTVIFSNNSLNENIILVDKTEASLFNSVRNYKKLFDHNARVVIYKSISKVIDFIINQLPGLKLNLDWNIIDLKVAMINSIIDYISYTLAAYATRIYIIGKYASPFIYAIDNNVANRPAPVYESFSNDEENNIEVNILQKTDDLIFKNPEKFNDFMNTLQEFLIRVGANDFGMNKPSCYNSYIPLEMQQSNSILNKFINNDFIIFIIRKRYEIFPYDPKDSDIYALQDILKECLINSKQGLSTSTTARQEILYIIRNIEPKDTSIKGYKGLAKDIYITALLVLKSITTLIESTVRWLDNENEKHLSTIAANNSATDILHMLRDIYCEIAEALFDKARYVENKINWLKDAEKEKIIKDISISIPGGEKDDLCLNNKMMKAIPDTTRIPLDLSAEYIKAEFESLQIRDQFLSTLSEFADSIYYDEAFNISDIINKIISIILAKAKSFETFFKNNGVDSAIKWTKTYHDELMSMDFTGKTMDALDYKNIITLPGGEAFKNNFIDGLSKFNKDILNDQKAADEFIKNLYNLDGSGIVYSWWYGESADNEKIEENAAKRYKNWILFCDKIADTGNDITTKTFADAYLTTEVKAWIETVSSADNIRKGYADLSNSVKNSINKIKSEVASIQKTNEDQKKKDLEAQQKEANSTSSTNDNTTNKSSNDQNTNLNTNETVNLEKFLNEVMLANQRLFVPIGDYFIEAIRNSYKYLKEAYTINKNPKNTEDNK